MERIDAASARPATLIARVEVAVGVLMELRGWDPSTSRAHLVLAADRADAPVEKVAAALLSLYDPLDGPGAGTPIGAAPVLR